MPDGETTNSFNKLFKGGGGDISEFVFLWAAGKKNKSTTYQHLSKRFLARTMMTGVKNAGFRQRECDTSLSQRQVQSRLKIFVRTGLCFHSKKFKTRAVVKSHQWVTFPHAVLTFQQNQKIKFSQSFLWAVSCFPHPGVSDILRKSKAPHPPIPYE